MVAKKKTTHVHLARHDTFFTQNSARFRLHKTGWRCRGLWVVCFLTLKLNMCLKIKPWPFHPLQKQHASKIQVTSHCYKTWIVSHLTRCFSSHKKSVPVPGRNAPDSKGNSGNILSQPCFDSCNY